MSQPGESVWSQADFDFRRGMYLHEHPIGANHGTVTVPLEGVVAPAPNDHGVSLYLPGIQVDITDFGLPQRQLVIEGAFPLAQHALIGTGRPLDTVDDLVVRWGAGKYERGDDWYESIGDGKRLDFVVPNYEYSVDAPIDNDIRITNSAGYVNGNDVLMLIMQRRGNELDIALHPELLGRIAFYAMTAPEQVDATVNTSVKNWLSKLGVEAHELPEGVYDEIGVLLQGTRRLAIELEKQRDIAATMTGNLSGQIRSLCSELDTKKRQIADLKRKLSHAGKEKPSSARTENTGSAHTSRSGSAEYCRTLGIDTAFFADLSEDQQRELVNSTRKRLAALFHPDRGGDAERLQIINRAADDLLDQLT